MYEKYINGNETDVWKEIISLGEKINEPEYEEEVLVVVNVMMERIKYNLNLIYDELLKSGYQFEDIENYNFYGQSNKTPIHFREVHVDTSEKIQTLIESLESSGKLPLVFLEWFKHIDIVDFRGSFPNLRSSMLLDPLFIPPVDELIESPFISFTSVEDLEYIYFSPDASHKEGISGGGGYGLLLTEKMVADSRVVGYSDTMTFVDYLRQVFRCGGFPALDNLDPKQNEYHKLVDKGIVEITKLIGSKTLPI